MKFRLTPVDLTLQAAVTKGAEGKVGWQVIGLGGWYEKAATQTLTLRLEPLYQQAGGSHVGDSTIADQVPRQPLMFHQGLALGVMIRHFPWKGGAALTILPTEQFTALPRSDPEMAKIVAALGLPAGELSVAGVVPLAGLVDVLIEDRLPWVGELDPYTLGATPSRYGSVGTYGQRDGYVRRDRDGDLAAALRPGNTVILVGPSKARKTRTAFEALRGHDRWGDALVAAPAPRHLEQLAGHPALAGPEPLVMWLDNLPAFLPPAGELSHAMIAGLLDRPGPAVLLATLRQARAASACPDVGSRGEGLAEVLAGALELLDRYHDVASANPRCTPSHRLREVVRGAHV